MQNSRVNRPQTASHPGTHRPRILVVEDDADQRSALAQRLRFEGYDAVFAADTPSAVRLARLQKPDLVILDLGLPGGDGYLVMERLRSLPEVAGIPVIVLSARDAAKEQPKALMSGAYAYFQKPISNGALRAALTHALQH